MTAPDLIAECANRLRPLLAEFDTRVLNQAAQWLADNDPAEQARIKKDCRRLLGSSPLFAELFPEETDQPERLA